MFRVFRYCAGFSIFKSRQLTKNNYRAFQKFCKRQALTEFQKCVLLEVENCQNHKEGDGFCGCF